MQKLRSYFFSGFNLKFQTQWFKRLLYGFVILKCIYWLCFYDLLFGDNSIVLTQPYALQHIGDLSFLLYSLGSSAAAYDFIIPVLLLSLFSLWRPAVYFLTDLIIWFLVLNLHNRIYASLTGGDYLMNQFLFFNCFLSARYMISGTWQNTMKLLLHNFGVVAVLMQVSLVYALSALAKLNDPDWLSGKAIFMVTQVKHFSLFSFTFDSLTAFIFVFLNYIVLAYQCAFPFLIWLKPIKKPLIVFGILMHLYIAFVMGLLSFGMIMIIAYIYFWPFRHTDTEQAAK